MAENRPHNGSGGYRLDMWLQAREHGWITRCVKLVGLIPITCSELPVSWRVLS